MTEETPSSSGRLKAPAITIAASVAAILLGIGLCAAGGLNLEGPSSATANLGTVLFFGGVLGFVVGVIWWLVALVTRSGK